MPTPRQGESVKPAIAAQVETEVRRGIAMAGTQIEVNKRSTARAGG